MGEKIGKEILDSRSEIKNNKNQLENPSSYEDYFEALPTIIRSFFQALLTVLQQHKEKVINNKRHQHYESVSQPLFGESLTTDNVLTMYETILKRMLDNRANDFEMEDVHSEITKQIPIGCNLLPPKIVKLEPGNPPNCNDNVHAACEMYCNDLPHGCDENLYIACDQAIFGRLISYKEAHNDVRLLLGQWHTSKDMCCTLITIFSGYGIYKLAPTLGVRYLDKFEHHVKKENKTMNDILSGNNYLIKVWYLFFRWTGYFIGHKIGIRRGNYEMQMANLAAFAPLFPAAGKFKYASSVAHFLAQVRDDLQLQNLLRIVCSVYLTNEGHYFAFDEALETYGVKFIKQNITGNVTDQQTMMSKIKAAQSERDRLSILLAEYIDNVVMSQNIRAVKSRKDSLWSLVEKLLSAFNHPNPSEHYLFEDMPEISEEGIKNILSFYETGKSRFQEVLAQDVYKTEPRTPGRRTRNINYYSYAHLENLKKKGRLDNPNQEPIVQQDTSVLQQILTNPLKRSRRTTTEPEKEILTQLFKFGDNVPETEILKVLAELQDISSSWTEERVKTYLKNNRHKYVKK
ncbi:16645_t:CDS:2 [Gigaspora rosea]|nr:16645_t:CDS:2 [Gigaspora rosea]